MANEDDHITIVDATVDVEKADTPFGKRWASQLVRITPAHLSALQQGKLLAIDAQGEYLVYLKLAEVSRV